MTKMAARSVFNKNPSHIFFSGTSVGPDVILAQETELCSVQTLSTVCNVQSVASFNSFKYKHKEMESMLAGGRSRFCCFVPII